MPRLLDDNSPIGVVKGFSGTTIPSGWLECYGQAVSRTTYAGLFTAISTTYGVGDGSTTFNLPDLRGRSISGKDNMGGTAANRITAGGSGITGTTLGAVGGAETHTLTAAQTALKNHSHTMNHTHTVAAVANAGLAGSNNYGSGAFPVNNETKTTSDVSSANTGGLTDTNGSAHNNTQPTIILNYIIKY